MWKELLDALVDTLWLVPWLLALHVLIEIFEMHSVSQRKLKKALRSPLAPLIGGVSGLLPQCGFGVVAADLYSRRAIRLGTMIAVFVATSDEAIPILIGGASKSAWIKLGALLGCKLVAALVAGYALNFLLRKRELLAETDDAEPLMTGCHHHVLGAHTHETVTDAHAHGADEPHSDVIPHVDVIPLSRARSANALSQARRAPATSAREYKSEASIAVEESSPKATEESSPKATVAPEKKHCRKKFDAKCYILHPVLHTLTVAGYILAVNIVFALVIYFVGEQRLADFLSSSRFYQPFLAGLVGLIPNCASSVILAQMFARGGITLGAAFAGLGVNAGLGLAVLLRKNRPVKNTLYIALGLYVYCCAVGVGLSFLPI